MSRPWSWIWPMILSGCVSFYQQPLPVNRSVAEDSIRGDGDRLAVRRLAEAYRRDQTWGSTGVGHNEAEFLRRSLLLAESGDVDSQLSLGDYHAGVDRERAIYWYMRALEGGRRQAAMRLVNLHGQSNGAASDHFQALLWSYVAENARLIANYEKTLSPGEISSARAQAEVWLAKEKK